MYELDDSIKYENIISLGWFCGPAQEIERWGGRDVSFPFDWLLTKDFSKVLAMIENDFEGWMKYDALYQGKNHLGWYEDIENKFVFVHDFLSYKSLDKQYESVYKKYSRRITRFIDEIKKPTLFIRYIMDQKEADFIAENYAQIEETIKKHCRFNKIVYISNVGIKSLFEDYAVEIDEGDSVARSFFDQIPDFLKWMDKHYAKAAKKNDNLRIHNLKEDKKKKYKKIKHYKAVFIKYCVPKYYHKKQKIID